ncbi:MAG: TolC family protein [Verrucomicrobiota bacterium]
MTHKIFKKNSMGMVAMAVLAGSALTAVDSKAETLTGAVEKVLSAHPQTKVAKAQADVAHYEALEIRGSLLPRLSLGGTMGPSSRSRSASTLVATGDWLNQSQGNATVRQRVFQRGLALNDTRAAKSRAKSANFLAEDVDQQLALLVIEAYLGILRGQEQVDLARENTLVHEDTLKKTETRKAAGRATQADIELVKARLGLARSSVETRKALLENAKVRYRTLVEEEPENLQSVGRLGSVPARVEHADISANPTLLAAKMNYEASKFQKEAGKGLLWPLFELELGGGLGNDVGGVRGTDDEAHAFLVASWDVWEGGARRAQKKQREMREEEALNMALSAQLQVEQELGSAIADRNGALLTEKQLTDYANAIAQVVGAYEKQVEVGSRAILNVLDVKNEDFRANSALVDAEFASLMAGYRVIAATGRIVEVVAPNAGDGAEDGGKNVVPVSAPEANWVEPAQEDAPMVADVEPIEASDVAPAPKKKGLFAKMFGGKKSKSKSKNDSSYQAYQAVPAVQEEGVTPAPTAKADDKSYSWSAVSPKGSKMVKTTPAPVAAPAPAVAATEAVVEEVAVEADDAADVAPEPKKKRGGFFKFLKPGGTVKSANDAETQEVTTGAVDEVAQSN